MDFCALQLLLEYFVIKSSKTFMKKKIKELKGIFCQNKGIFKDWPKTKEFKGISSKIKEQYDACILY